MREFIKLIESEWTDEDQAASDEMDARYAREKKVEALIRHVLEKLGMEIADRAHAIGYDEASGRECTVYLYGPVKLDTLVKLQATGLGEFFAINTSSSHYDEMVLEFVVAEGMENATPQ